MGGSTDAPKPESAEMILRNAIHETSASKCGTGDDTCPDWPLAYELVKALQDMNISLISKALEGISEINAQK